MKKMHILGVAIVLIAIALIISASKDMSTYATFSDALSSASSFRVVGTLEKDKEMYYNPAEDPNYFTFYMKDRDGEVHQVVLSDAKPQDFEQTEQIVVSGKFVEDAFWASDILIKCPSKYKDEELALKG